MKVALMDRSLFWMENQIKFSLAPMGVLAPRSAHTIPCAQPPIDTIRNLFSPISIEKLTIIAVNNHTRFVENSYHP